MINTKKNLMNYFNHVDPLVLGVSINIKRTKGGITI